MSSTFLANLNDFLEIKNNIENSALTHPGVLIGVAVLMLLARVGWNLFKDDEDES